MSIGMCSKSIFWDIKIEIPFHYLVCKKRTHQNSQCRKKEIQYSAHVRIIMSIRKKRGKGLERKRIKDFYSTCNYVIKHHKENCKSLISVWSSFQLLTIYPIYLVDNLVQVWSKKIGDIQKNCKLQKTWRRKSSYDYLHYTTNPFAVYQNKSYLFISKHWYLWNELRKW